MILYDFYEKSQKRYPARGLKKGSPRKKTPPGVQKEEIQKWRQARSRPGEKETHNIKLREK